MTTTHRPRPLFSTWPRNRYADWVPAVADQEQTRRLLDPNTWERLIAVTVFVSYRLPDDLGYGASCVCGESFQHPNRQMMRAQVSRHRCVDRLGAAPGPLPPMIDPTDVGPDLLSRVLSGLRAL